MTPEEHNEYVGLAQLAYAGAYLGMMIGMTGLQNFILLRGGYAEHNDGSASYNQPSH